MCRGSHRHGVDYGNRRYRPSRLVRAAAPTIENRRLTTCPEFEERSVRILAAIPLEGTAILRRALGSAVIVVPAARSPCDRRSRRRDYHLWNPLRRLSNVRTTPCDQGRYQSEEHSIHMRPPSG